MKFLEILGLSAVTTAGISLFACVTAWLCTSTIGSWLVAALLVAFMLFICIKASNGRTLLHMLWEEILSVCVGFAIMLCIFWFVGNFLTESLNMQTTIGYNIVCGALALMSAAALFITLILTLLFLAKAVDMIFSSKHGAFSDLQSYLSFITAVLCNLAIMAAVGYYILYPIGLA